MATPQTAKGAVIPIPVLGMNMRDSILDMDPLYSDLVFNVDTDGRKLSVRNEFEYFGTVESHANYILGLGVHGDPSASSSKLFAYSQGDGAGADPSNKVWLGNGDGTFSVAYTLGSNTADEVYPINYKNQLGFSVEASPSTDSARYDGSSWSSLGFTVGGVHIPARGGCEYKGRVYLFNGTDAVYYSSSTPGAVTGACTGKSFVDFFRYADNGGFIETLSSPGDRPSETYIAIGTRAGEILVYGGDYPDSATWALVGKYKVAPLVGYRAAAVINNDIWIMTIAGIVTLRSLMSKGADAYQELSPSYYIQPFWTRLIDIAPLSSSTAVNVSIAYWPEKNKVYIFVPATVTTDGSSSTTISGTILVYDVSSKGWTIHEIPSTIFTNSTDTLHSTRGGLTYFQNNLYFHVGPHVYRYGTGYMDDNDPSRTGSSPYFWAAGGANSTLGNPLTHKKVIGWNPMLKIDNATGSSVFMTTSIDIQREITAPTYMKPISGVNSQTLVNGGHGTSFQWRLYGLTNVNMAGPIELYSMGVIV